MIKAYLQRWITRIDSILLFLLISIFYIAAVAAPIAGFKGSLAVGIMSGIFATVILIRFLYTFYQWKSQNILLDFIDRVATTEREQYF